VRIPDLRRKQGLVDHAHWCTGTLKLQDGFGNSVDVINPYTYEQLRAKASPGSIDRYLLCVSQLQYGKRDDQFNGISCESIRPDDSHFKKQKTSLIAVLERCKSNYQQKQWDVGAYMAYDPKLMKKMQQGLDFKVQTLSLEDGVGPCLLQAHLNRESNLFCMTVSIAFDA
jgi:hypothetical protein